MSIGDRGYRIIGEVRWDLVGRRLRPEAGARGHISLNGRSDEPTMRVGAPVRRLPRYQRTDRRHECILRCSAGRRARGRSTSARSNPQTPRRTRH